MEAAVHHNSSESDTISDTNLSPVQAQVIAALAQGRTATDAARDAGIHRTTIHHWFRTQPLFNTALHEAQREYVETLHDGMRDRDPLVQIYSAAILGKMDPKDPTVVSVLIEQMETEGRKIQEQLQSPLDRLHGNVQGV